MSRPPLSQFQGSSSKKRRRAEHDAELLPLLQGTVIEVTVGSGDNKASWTIPVALLVRHCGYFRALMSIPVKEEDSNTTKVSLPDREPFVFQIFVQWLYFDTIPDRLGLSRLSTGKSLSNSFLLWTLGDYLQADAFKNRIMHELYRLHSLDGYTDVLRFVEFTAAEVDYCWSQTMLASKLREFVLDTLAQHIVHGNYICMDDDKDWAKVFTKHADLQLQVLSTIARSFIVYDEGITKVLPVDTYLEVVRPESQLEEEMPSQS